MTTAQRIYLDNAATTPIAEEVVEAMIAMMREHYGNPSSTHAHGRKVKGIIEEARGSVAKMLGCSPGEIFFTSGGTEADNLAIRGSVANLGIENIISSAIEHHAVLHTVEELHHKNGVGLHMVNLLPNGHVDMAHLQTLLNSATKPLVSLMHANNEIGNIIDIETVGQMVHQAGGIFHCDTVQTMGQYRFDLSQGHVDFLAGAAHKFNGPKGVGFIYINKKNRIPPQITGGAQDNGSATRQATGNWVDWLGADGMEGLVSPTNHLNLWGTSQNSSIYRSINGGNSYNGLPKPSNGQWVTPLWIHPTNETILYGGWTGVYKSTTSGTSWTNISGATITTTLTDLAVSTSNPNYIYASNGSTLYVTTDDGATWATRSAPATINDICIDPTDPTKIWVALIALPTE